MLDLSTSTDPEGNPGSLRGSGIGPKREPSTSGAISSLPGLPQSQFQIFSPIKGWCGLDKLRVHP